MKTGKVVGGATSKVWAQVDAQVSEKMVVLTGVIVSYEGESDVLDLALVGGEVLEALSQAGAECRTATDLDRRMLQIETPIADVEVGLAVVVARDKELLASTKGGIEVYLKRGKTLSRLQTGDGPAVSGTVENNDVVVLATSDVVEKLGLVKWRETMERGVEGLEELAVAVHSLSSSEKMAIMMGEVDGETGIGSRLSKIWDKFASRFWKTEDKLIVVSRETKRVNTMLGAGLIVLLAIGIIVGVVKRGAVQKEQAISNLSHNVTEKLTEAAQVALQDGERASYLLIQANTEVEKFKKETKRESDLVEAEKLTKQIKQKEAEIFKKKIVDPKVLVELAVLEPVLELGVARGDGGDGVLLTDKRMAGILGVNLEDKSSWKIKGGPYIDLAVYEGDTYGIEADGVYKIAKKGGEEQRIIEADELWDSPQYIGIYGGNVYVMDRGVSEIWKYAKLSEGYGARKRWLAPGIELDFSNVSDMWIDGDVWIVTSSGKLERYSRGVPVEFAMAGLPYAEQGRLSGAVAVVTDENMVYVLEAGASRVVAFERESGHYTQQYVSEKLKEGRGLVIVDKKAFVVTDSQIIWFDL